MRSHIRAFVKPFWRSNFPTQAATREARFSSGHWGRLNGPPLSLTPPARSSLHPSSILRLPSVLLLILHVPSSFSSDPAPRPLEGVHVHRGGDRLVLEEPRAGRLLDHNCHALVQGLSPASARPPRAERGAGEELEEGPNGGAKRRGRGKESKGTRGHARGRTRGRTRERRGQIQSGEDETREERRILCR